MSHCDLRPNVHVDGGRGDIGYTGHGSEQGKSYDLIKYNLAKFAFSDFLIAITFEPKFVYPQP